MAAHADTAKHRLPMPIPALQPYANRSGHSGVVAYAASGAGLLVEFSGGSVYFYSLDVPGRRHVERMKSLADAGSGLSSYISRHVGQRFAARLR